MKKPRRNEESVTQKSFFAEVFIREQQDWRYGLVFGIPMQGVRTYRNAGRLKAEGMRAGLLDVLVMVPCGKYCGLAIEFKSKTGKLSENQTRIAQKLKQAGHLVVLCRTAEQGIFVLKKYFAGEL